MTVAAAAAKAGPYTGNDSASSFAFSFKVFADGDIRVVKTVIASGAESDLVLNTDYTVTRNVDQDTNPGGSVVYKVGGVTTALPSTLKLTIVGDFDYAQPTDIPNGGSFFASVIETAFDRVTMLIKQLKERVDNALTLPVSVSGVSAELPTPEAGTVIGWNTTADALVNLDAASLAGAVAAVDWLVDTFDGTGAQTAFVLTRDPGVAANCDISISGVTQVPGVDFTVSGTSLTFTTAPASGTDNICVRYGSALPSAASVPVNGVATASIQDLAVTTGKIADDAVTYAKMQNVSATSRILGRKTAAAGDTEECTLSEVLDFIGSAAQGDILYRGASAWVRLGAGTSGHFLKTQGAGANPAWAAVPTIFTAAYDSGDQTISSGGGLSLTHSLGAKPKVVQFYAKCLTAENDYSIGDEIQLGGPGVVFVGAGSSSCGGFVSIADATTITVRFGNGAANPIAALHKTSGALSSLTNANWALVVRAYA